MRLWMSHRGFPPSCRASFYEELSRECAAQLRWALCSMLVFFLSSLGNPLLSLPFFSCSPERPFCNPMRGTVSRRELLLVDVRSFFEVFTQHLQATDLCFFLLHPFPPQCLVLQLARDHALHAVPEELMTAAP